MNRTLAELNTKKYKMGIKNTLKTLDEDEMNKICSELLNAYRNDDDLEEIRYHINACKRIRAQLKDGLKKDIFIEEELHDLNQLYLIYSASLEYLWEKYKRCHAPH